MLYDRKNQRVKWDTSDPWIRDSAAARRADGDGFASTAAAPPGTPPGAPWSEMAGFAGSVQSFSGAAASEMLDTLFGPGGAETIAAMKARARDQAAPAADPSERLARLQALRDGGVLTEAGSSCTRWIRPAPRDDYRASMCWSPGRPATALAIAERFLREGARVVVTGAESGAGRHSTAAA